MTVDHQSYTVESLISAEEIASRVNEIAAEISDFFSDTDRLLVIGLLRGSFVYMADLVRAIHLPIEVDFLEVSSYGDAMESSGEVRITKDLRDPLAGNDVLIVEDIIDSGHTLEHVTAMLRARNPKRLEITTLLDKPSRREVEMKARWVGFTIPDEFVVGYGIDYAQRNRNLPYIGRVLKHQRG